MNFTSQICTTKTQSERLLALGLKKETADMVILEHPRKEGRYFYTAKEDANWFGLPAWSLHRLLQIIPHSITRNNQEYRRTILGEWIVFKHPLKYEYAVVSNYDSIYENCAYCIEWLIKEEHFNKEYLN